MKRLALLILIAFSPMALSQDKPAADTGPTATPLSPTPAPAAAPAPPPAAASAPAAPSSAPVAKAAKPSAPMSASRKARREEDARHCLEKASNTEIIKCAEAYL
jgi:hypothetical protein